MRTKHGEIKGRPKNSSESDQFWSQDKTAEMQNQCAEIKIRAERKAGGMLKTSLRNKGETDKRIISHDGILSPKLNELGITFNQSHRWQTVRWDDGYKKDKQKNSWEGKRPDIKKVV